MPKGVYERKKPVKPKCTTTPDMPEGYNTETIAFMMDVIPDDPPDINDVESMRKCFENYIRKCMEHDRKVSNMAAYASMGINKRQAWEWSQGMGGNPARTNFIRKVQMICAMYRESLMADGKINPVTGLFWQKNFDNFRDQQEIVVTPNNPLGDSLSNEELARKYKDDSYLQSETVKSIETHETIDTVDTVVLTEDSKIPTL